ncbi:histidine kinase [Paenibacillus cisolokensis]
MTVIADFYKRHFRQKLFNKILLTYSVITILSLATLSGFVYTYLADGQVNKELELNKQILADIGNYLDARYAISQNITQQIYRNESSLLSGEVLSFLQNDFSQYLYKRLQQYIDTGVRPLDIGSYLRLQLANNPGIRTISLYSTSKKFLYVLSRDTQYYYQTGAELQEALNEHIITKKSITTISNITDLTTRKIVGHLIIDYDSDGIYQSFQSKRAEMKGYVVVLTPEGDVVFDSSNRYYGQKYPYFASVQSASPTQRFEEEAYLNVHTANRFGFYIAGIVPKSEIAGQLKGLKNALFLVTIACIMTAVALTYFTIVTFSRRTNVIVQAMKKLQDGDLSVRLPLEKEDELYQISRRFNQMCEDLTQYIDRVYKSEIRQKQAELVAFQAQIKPHFMYNTLEAIRMRALSKKADDVGEMIYLLATLFRYSVRKDTIVTLADELEYCSLYLDLFRIRYMNNFTYEIDIEPEWMNVPVLKLSLQPLVENYVVHGLVMSRTDNRLRIEAEPEGDLLKITVRDNGNGIEPEKLEELRRRLREPSPHASDSIGLTNVHERIKICFGSAYGLQIDGAHRQGAAITMTIPASPRGHSSA